MKKLLVTIGGVPELIMLPLGSRIIEEGSGSKIFLNKKASTHDIVVTDSIATLFSQLSDSINITVAGKKIVLVLTQFSKIVANGTGSTISFRGGIGSNRYNATESVSTLNAQLSSGSGSGTVQDFSFSTVNAQTSYSIAEVGVDLTGKTLGWLKLNQTIIADVDRSILSGGIKFEFNPNVKTCYGQYT